MGNKLSGLSADEPQTNGSLGLVYVYEIGFVVFDLIESSRIDSTTRIVGRVREILHPIPHGLAVDEAYYVSIETRDDGNPLRRYSEVCLYPEQPVLLLSQNEKGE